VSQHVDDKLDRRGQRQVNETVALRVPKEVIEQKCALYMRRGKPAQRGMLIRDSDYSMGSQISVGVSRDRSVLSLSSQCWLVQQIALDRRNIATQNAGRQTSVERNEDGKEVQSHHRNASWTKERLASRGSTRQQEAAGDALWGNSPQAQTRRHPC
jgi:hypothetical protein